MAFALDQKKRLFWTLRGNMKADSSSAAHEAVKPLSPKRRKKEVLDRFDDYCDQLGALIDEAAPIFVEMVSRLEELGLQDRIATVRSHVEDCIINPSTKRDSIVRWLADACEGHPPLEALRALHDDPNSWVAPRWLAAPRTRVEKRNRVWFFVAGSKRTRVSR